MDNPSWQTMGLAIQSEFQTWTAQLLQGLTLPKDCIVDLPALEQLDLAVDSLAEIETGFWQLAAALTEDFLPSGEVRGLHPNFADLSAQRVENYTPDWHSSEEPQSLMAQLPQGENTANLSEDLPVYLSSQPGVFQEASKTRGLENGGNRYEESSLVSLTPSLVHQVEHHLNADIPITSEHFFHSLGSLAENLSSSDAESVSRVPIPVSHPETTQQSEFPEPVKKNPKQPWISVTPVATSANSVVPSNPGKSQPVVRTWIESEGENSVVEMRSPSSEVAPIKGLGDLANLLSLSTTQGLDWQDEGIETESKSINSPSLSQEKSKQNKATREKLNSGANSILETDIQAIAPITDFPHPEVAHQLPPPPSPELDVEEVLEAVQRRINQEYRRFYGG